MASKQELIQWLKGDSRLLKWAMIAAFDRATLNRFLLQEYIRRFSDQSFFPPVSGPIDSANGQWRYRIESFVLDTPRLSFENADLNDSKARMTMQVVGGSLVSEVKVGNQWHARELETISPLSGPELQLAINLADAPGLVSDGGELLIDLSRSSDFTLTITEGAEENLSGGLFFEAFFKELEDEQRRYIIGMIQRNEEALLKPHSFLMRTQSTGAGGEGGVLGLIRAQGTDFDGDQPGAGSDFRYLIPDGSTATVLIDPAPFILPSLIENLSQKIENVSTALSYNPQGHLSKVRVTGGTLELPKVPMIVRMPVPEEFRELGFEWVYARFTVEESSVPATGLELDLDNARAKSHWPLKIDSSYKFAGFVDLTLNATYLLALEFARSTYPDDYEKIVAPHPFAFDMAASGEYYFDGGTRLKYRRTAVRDGVLDKSSHAFTAWNADTLAQKKQRALSDTTQTHAGSDPALWFLYIGLVLYLIADAVKHFLADEQIETKIAEQLETLLLLALPARVNVAKPVNDIMKLNFGNVIDVQDTVTPHDVAVFGNVSPSSTQIELTTHEHTLSAGQTFAFEARTDVARWSVEAVPGMGPTGTINDAGLYTAPAVDAIEGTFSRARVIATAANGSTSAALITVVRNPMLAKPLIKASSFSSVTAFKATSFASGATYAWTVKPQKWGGSIKPCAEGRTAEFTPYPYVEDDGDDDADYPPSFLLEEITVTDNKGSVRNLHHITEFFQSPLSVRIKSQDAHAVALEARLNNKVKNTTQWSVLVGPGSISDEGVYTVSDVPADVRYAVIAGTYDSDDLGTMESYIILALPLTAEARALPGTVHLLKGQGLSAVRPL